MMKAFRYAVILLWGSVGLLGANVHIAGADGDHGGMMGMMGGHMMSKMHEGHDQSKQDEQGCHALKHLLKHEKELGLIPEQIRKLKTMQLDLSRAQIRAEADIKVAKLELHALVEDEQADSAVIQAKVDQLKKAEGGLLFVTIKSTRDAMALLTPEQREKEQALRDKMMEKMMGGEGRHAGGMSGMKGGEHGKDGGAGKEGAAEHQH